MVQSHIVFKLSDGNEVTVIVFDWKLPVGVVKILKSTQFPITSAQAIQVVENILKKYGGSLEIAWFPDEDVSSWTIVKVQE